MFCNQIGIVAYFLCFVVVFYCLGVVICDPFYMSGIEEILEAWGRHFCKTLVVFTRLFVLAGDK